MSRAAVIGEEIRVQGYVLAGALVYPADDHEKVTAAWGSLPDDVAVVLLTEQAAAWLGDELGRRPAVLTAVMRA